jgi:hypothetical protein
MFGECKLEQDTLSNQIDIKNKKTASLRFFCFKGMGEMNFPPTLKSCVKFDWFQYSKLLIDRFQLSTD